MATVNKALLVDDDEDLLLIGKMALQDVGGWPTLVASSGREAIEIAAREQPDVILLDMMMPGMDGALALQLLRANPATRDIPVVFMTAKVQPEDLRRYLDLGAAGVVCKPFDPLALAGDIQKILERAAAP
jgi:CheY-like chemotaxis protein